MKKERPASSITDLIDPDFPSLYCLLLEVVKWEEIIQSKVRGIITLDCKF